MSMMKVYQLGFHSQKRGAIQFVVYNDVLLITDCV